MKINNDYTTSFTGIYRMPCTVKNLKEFKTHVAPMYEYIRHEPVLVFGGNNPFKIGVDVVMDIIADSQNSSTDWLRMNATRHGANLSGIGDDICHVVAGKKEMIKFFKYIQNRAEKKESFTERVKRFFNINTNSYEDKPEHLRDLFKAIELNGKENIAFKEAYGDRIVDVKTTQELLAKMLCEK